MQTSLHFSAPDLSAGLPAALVGPAPASTAGCDSLRVPKMEQPNRGGLRGLSCLRRGSGDLQGGIPSTFQEKKTFQVASSVPLPAEMAFQAHGVILNWCSLQCRIHGPYDKN